MSSHANIGDTPFHQNSPQTLEEGVLWRHTQIYKQTSGHHDSMTESAKLADSLKTQLKSLNPDSGGMAQ